MSKRKVSKRVKDIVEETTTHLTGSDEENAKYLMKQAEKYREDPEGGDIAYILGLIMWDYLPQTFKDEFSKALKKDMEAWPPGMTMEEVFSKINPKKN